MTRIPTASATTTVRVWNSRPLFGSVNPTALNSLNRPFASSSPRNRPTTEATTPVTSASTTTERSTWFREAPSVRSVANSRVRWAIVIESEFAITNAPTKSATPPNASRKSWRNERKLFVSDASLEACASPDFTCVPGGRTLRTCASSAACVTPAFFATRIWSSLPLLSKRFCAVREVEPRERGPADRGDGAEVDEAGDAQPLDRAA